MRGRTAARATGVTLLAAAVLTGCGVHRPPKREVDRGLSGGEQIACARRIVEGDVLDVHKAQAKNRLSVTLSVADWIKPAHGASTVHLDLADPATVHGKRPTAGDHVLMIVPKARDNQAVALRGDDLTRYRTSLPLNLRRAKKATCPEWAAHL
jgi:hypothetical protein